MIVPCGIPHLSEQIVEGETNQEVFFVFRWGSF